MIKENSQKPIIVVNHISGKSKNMSKNVTYCTTKRMYVSATGGNFSQWGWTTHCEIEAPPTQSVPMSRDTICG